MPFPRFATAISIAVVVGQLVAGTADAGDGAYSVTANPSAQTVTIGKKVAVNGSVSPVQAGVKVLLQVKSGRTWSTMKAAKVASSGEYRVLVNPTKPGRANYRVCKSGDSVASTGCSASFVITTFQWRYLADFARVASYYYGDVQYPGVEGTVLINGRSYPKSYTIATPSEQPGYVEYNLNRKCAKFDARVGAWDENSTGSVVGVNIFTDGTSRLSGQYGVGASINAAVDTRNTLRLRIEAFNVDDPGTDFLAVGSPRVYCSF